MKPRFRSICITKLLYMQSHGQVSDTPWKVCPSMQNCVSSPPYKPHDNIRHCLKNHLLPAISLTIPSPFHSLFHMDPRINDTIILWKKTSTQYCLLPLKWINVPQSLFIAHHNNYIEEIAGFQLVMMVGIFVSLKFLVQKLLISQWY